jgi:hypothetical protein
MAAKAEEKAVENNCDAAAAYLPSQKHSSSKRRFTIFTTIALLYTTAF